VGPSMVAGLQQGMSCSTWEGVKGGRGGERPDFPWRFVRIVWGLFVRIHVSLFCFFSHLFLYPYLSFGIVRIHVSLFWHQKGGREGGREGEREGGRAGYKDGGIYYLWMEL
jgi:hypothetical protein